jgi:hypothetical protein
MRPSDVEHGRVCEDGVWCVRLEVHVGSAQAPSLLESVGVHVTRVRAA